MVLFPCSPELFDRRFRGMAAVIQYEHSVMCATRKPPASQGRWAASRSQPAMTTATGQVYESLLDPSGKEAATAVSPEETAP